MIEVFKTSVCYGQVARQLVKDIESDFPGYKANFDLDDSDHILRIQNNSGIINVIAVIDFMKKAGFSAVLLTDEVVNIEHKPVCHYHQEMMPGQASHFADICVHLRRIHKN